MPVAGGKVRLNETGCNRPRDKLLKVRWLGQFSRAARPRLFPHVAGDALLSLAEQFLFARRDKEKFRRDLAPWPDTRRIARARAPALAQARKQLLLRLVTASAASRRISPTSGNNFAHERMQRGDKFAQMPPQKFKRHLQVRN